MDVLFHLRSKDRDTYIPVFVFYPAAQFSLFIMATNDHVKMA